MRDRQIRRRRLHRTLGPIVLAAAVAPLAACAGSSSAAAPAAPPVVAVEAVHRETLARTIDVTAELQPYQEIDVHSKVAGFVQGPMPVDVGDRVTAGQTLATLEIPELQDDVQEADAAVAAATSNIDKTKADVDRAQSAYNTAHLWSTRLAGVAKTQTGLVAQQELDDASDRDRVAAAEVTTAKAAEAAAEEQLLVAKAQQARTKALFDYSHITAPFAGVVTKRYADTGSMIQASTSSQTQAMPIVRLAEDDRLRLVIPVPESAVGNIHLGSPVSVRVPTLDRTFTGRVARFAAQVDPVTRTMHTEVDVENPSHTLVAGVYALASLTLEERPNVLAVPIEALDRTDSRVSVMRVGANHTLEVRPVTLGIETATEAEVTSGLADGDLVVVGARGQLRPGLVVAPDVSSPGAGAR